MPFAVSGGEACIERVMQQNLLPASTLCANNYAIWFHVIQQDTEDMLACAMHCIQGTPALAHAVDAHGRTTVSMCTPGLRAHIQSLFLWHGRYRVVGSYPEHISSTCVVYKAVDERCSGGDSRSEAHPPLVALKLMRHKEQFLNEIASRSGGLSEDHVIQIISSHPSPNSALMEGFPDALDSGLLVPLSANTTPNAAAGVLSKTQAEQLFCLVLPYADRNMFVALKQERFAGRDFEAVRHVFLQLVKGAAHIHSKGGLIHSDIKPLNMLRTDAVWRYVDLDAAGRIGDDWNVKCSSAYVPPECAACLVQRDRSIAPLPKASPAIDLWALGAVLYQMCTSEVKQLFPGDLDDNISRDVSAVDDNIYALIEWSAELKDKKLSKVEHVLARNLLSQMLQKDSTRRPSLTRVLAHPFLSTRPYTRLQGEPPLFDIFLSYRVASDSSHVEEIYNALCSEGLRVWWDKKCLLPGKDWKEGFISGLMSSRFFVCILSRGAVNHSTKSWQNFSHLTGSSACDNVLLEHLLALELRALGLLEGIFPVMIGDYNAASDTYSNFFTDKCCPICPNVTVQSVMADLSTHMENECLGSPVLQSHDVKTAVDEILRCQGALVEGPRGTAFDTALQGIFRMVT